jgi:hypothetical protein
VCALLLCVSACESSPDPLSIDRGAPLPQLFTEVPGSMEFSEVLVDVLSCNISAGASEKEG